MSPVLLQVNVDFICSKLAESSHRLQGGLQMLELHLQDRARDAYQVCTPPCSHCWPKSAVLGGSVHRKNMMSVVYPQRNPRIWGGVRFLELLSLPGVHALHSCGHWSHTPYHHPVRGFGVFVSDSVVYIHPNSAKEEASELEAMALRSLGRAGVEMGARLAGEGCRGLRGGASHTTRNLVGAERKMSSSFVGEGQGQFGRSQAPSFRQGSSFEACCLHYVMARYSITPYLRFDYLSGN